MNWNHHEPTCVGDTSSAKSQAELLRCRGRQTPVLGWEEQEGSLVLPGCQGMCKSLVVECPASPRPWGRLSSPCHALSATALLPWDTRAGHLTPVVMGMDSSPSGICLWLGKFLSHHHHPASHIMKEDRSLLFSLWIAHHLL